MKSKKLNKSDETDDNVVIISHNQNKATWIFLALR